MKHPKIPMKYRIPPRALRCCSLAASLLAIFLFSSSASALLMRDNGPEPIIVQVKESLRLSDELDTALNKLAQLQREAGVTVEKSWAGPKLLQLVSFPKDFTEEEALAVINTLQECDGVEKVVPVSASNLEFKSADFVREYPSNQAIPEAARRGLDRNELERSAKTPAQIEEAAKMPHVPNQLIVRWKSSYVWRATASGFLKDIANFHAAGGARVIREMKPSPTDLTQVIEIDEMVTPFADKLRRYVNCPWVDYAQPNFVYTLDAVTNDPLYNNPGQPNLPKISAPSAWLITKGTQNLVVAVADTGAPITHPEFAPNLSPGWRNYSVDPWNTDVTDGSGHGSHVASIIGAKGNNGLFMTGVAWNVSLLIVKADQGGGADSVRFSDAINYAWSNDGHNPAIAINVSSSTHYAGIDDLVQSAVRNARVNNMVVVASGGNYQEDVDQEVHFTNPSCIPVDNVLSVGSTTLTPAYGEQRAYYSNWGPYTIELGAPGGDGGTDNCAYGIIGLLPDPNAPAPTCTPGPIGWKRSSGTSFAAPHVAGALALVKSVYPWENYWGLKDRVIMATDDIAALDGWFRTGGRLNLAKALKTRTLIKTWSTRAKVETGDRIIIGGFTISGSPAVPLKVAIRGLGPSLPPLGVARLNDPKLQLNNSIGGFVASNDDWGNLTPQQKADLAAAGLTPGNIHEAAIVATLVPGSYSVLMQSQDGQQGVGLFEIYELRGTTTEETRLRNISTRCPVGVGDEIAIAGTTLQNPTIGSVPKRRLLLMGRGSSLQPGVTGTLPNPYLELRNSSGAIIAYNDQWKDIDGVSSSSLQSKLVESQLRPIPKPGVEQHENESAIWPTLAGGTYTAFFRDAAGASGIGLIEVYEY